MRTERTTRRAMLKMLGLAGLSTVAGTSLLAACQPSPQPSPVAKADPTKPTAPAGSPVAAGSPAAAAPAPAAAGSSSEDMSLRVGYLPITDATPLLLAHANNTYKEEGLEAPKPTLFRGWSQLAEAFQARQVDVVHILMPTAVWMRFGQNFPVKMVAWNHTDGSALTVANSINTFEDLAGQIVAIPFWYSIHNAVLQLLFRQGGLKPITKGDAVKADKTVKLVVMAPADMPPALAQNQIAGYIVADPFNAAAEVNNVGKVFRFTGDVWLNHACCVVIMHEDDIAKRPRWAQGVVNAVAKAQVFARENRQQAARLLTKEGGDYLPQPLPVVERALTHFDKAAYGASKAIIHPDWPNNRIDFQPFPFPTYTEELIKLLKETQVEGDDAFLKNLDPKAAHAQLVEDRFARAAITAAGGPAKFGIDPSLARTERIQA